MRLAYVIDSLAPGGAEHSLAAMAPHLTAAGVDLTVYVLKDRDGLEQQIRQAGGKVRSVAGNDGRVAATLRLRGALAADRPDLVHTTLFEADLVGRTASRLLGLPAVSTLANDAYSPSHLDREGLSRLRVELARCMDMATAKFVWRFHAVSAHVATTMSDRLRIDPGKIDVVHRGRDAQVLGERSEGRRCAARASLGVSADTFVVLAVGRQEPQKGFDTLLRAWDRFAGSESDVRLLVVGGEGSATPGLRAELARTQAQGHVSFLGYREDLYDLFCAGDAFVLPSRREGLPGVVLEAMALETPIVASDLPQVREAVPDERFALLVPPEDDRSLADALVCMRREDRASLRTERARQRFLERFTIEKAVEGMLAFYDRTLSRRRA